MMTHKLTLYFLVLISPVFIQCISIIGPRVLRPYGPYKVSISGGSRAQSVYVAIEGRRANGEQYTQGREIQVLPASSRIIELQIGDPGPGVYELIARSTSGPQFSSSAPLVYQHRSFCVFLQTDKRVYQPGDTIHFTVVALDKYLLPLEGTVDVTILDTKGTPIRQWASLSLDRGLLSQDLLLADEPALGEWSIQVEVRGQTYSRHVLVADYIMPKFELDMQLPKEVLFAEGRFNINVTAKHFNGLPVRGELTISAYAVFFSGLLQPVFSSPARKFVDFNGQNEVTFNLKTDLDLAEDAVRPLVVEAVLEEKDTLIRQNVSKRILLIRTPYKVKVTAPDHFKPMLPYKVQIEAQDLSGKVLDTNDDVTIEKLWDDGAPVNITTLSLNKGRATYNLTPDAAHMKSTLNLVIKYKDVAERVINVHSSSAAGGQYLTVDVLSSGTGVGDHMSARISATEPMDLLNYIVLGRGDILHAKTVELSPARKSVDISVPVTPGMGVGCVLLAWYSRLSTDNSVVASAVYVPHHNALQHQVSVSVSGGYRPGGSLEVKVTGEANSHAALLAADTLATAAGLATDNGLGTGLDMHTIEREVESFSGLKHSLFRNQDQFADHGFDLGGNTTRDVFQNVGVVILTDNVLGSFGTEEPNYHHPPETGTRPPLAGPYAFSREPPALSPRYYLSVSPQPTWMLKNLSLGDDGTEVENPRSPATSGDWLIGAFAVHPTLGLGLASPQTFKTSVPLTINAELPTTLQKGETLAAIVTLKSTLTVDTSVEVTFHNSEQYFEFEPLDNNLESSKRIELFRRLRLTIPAKGLISTAFLVTVVKTGEAPIIVEATGNGLSASLFRTIDVKDGYEMDLWSWTILDARRGVGRGNVTLDVLRGVEVGAVSLSAAGAPLAPALQLARRPPPSAALPAHSLALPCIILDYLQTTGEQEPAIAAEALVAIAKGYQRLMAFRLFDGSFSMETGDGAAGDVWLTSQAARWLSRCGRYVQVSPVAAQTALRWLVDTQQPDGGWPLVPKPLRIDPNAHGRLPSAAYAVLALVQAQGGDVLFRGPIQSAVSFLAGNLSPDLDAYTLALIGNALSATKHPQSVQALQMMDKYANTTGSYVFWSRKMHGNEWRNPWLKGNTFEATTAAFGLKTMLLARLIDETLPVAKYLMQAVGPDQLEPDVVDALAEFSKAIKTNNKLRLSVNVTGSEEPRQFNIDNENPLILQTQLVRKSRSASAVTEGRGVAVVGLTSRGRSNATSAWPRYTLDPRVDHVSTAARLQLSICIGFVPQGNETESGLTKMIVQFPSGYLADINTLTELMSSGHVVRARLQAGAVAAWLRADRAERCATLAAARALPVAAHRPGYVALQDLYDSSHRARVFFQPVASHACDVCREWASCASACGATQRQLAASDRAPPASPDSASAHTLTIAVAMLAALFLFFH